MASPITPVDALPLSPSRTCRTTCTTYNPYILYIARPFLRACRRQSRVVCTDTNTNTGRKQKHRLQCPPSLGRNRRLRTTIYRLRELIRLPQRRTPARTRSERRSSVVRVWPTVFHHPSRPIEIGLGANCDRENRLPGSIDHAAPRRSTKPAILGDLPCS